MDRIETALACYARGCNCAQSVLSAYAPDFDLDSEQALRLAAAFGGGMGRSGQTCGAVSGAVMVIGLRYGAADPQDKAAKEHTYQLTQRFLEEFRARHNAASCPDLLGVDIGHEDGLAFAREQELFSRFCSGYVRSAAEILETILED